jgi:ammonia channel protein AmtB
VLCCAVWVLGNMIPFWFILKVCGLLRATADEEALGLDSSHHVSYCPLPQPPAL